MTTPQLLRLRLYSFRFWIPYLVLYLRFDLARFPCGHYVATSISTIDWTLLPMLAWKLTSIHAPILLKVSTRGCTHAQPHSAISSSIGRYCETVPRHNLRLLTVNNSGALSRSVF